MKFFNKLKFDYRFHNGDQYSLNIKLKTESKFLLRKKSFINNKDKIL